MKYTVKKSGSGKRHIIQLGRLRLTFTVGRFYTGARLTGYDRRWTAGTIALPFMLFTWLLVNKRK